MSDQIMPPEQADPAERQADLDKIVLDSGPWDVVYHGFGLYRPADLGPGRSNNSRGGFRHANY